MTEQEKTTGRPVWLPAKFESPEAMVKSYQHLEKEYHAQRPPAETAYHNRIKEDTAAAKAQSHAEINHKEAARLAKVRGVDEIPWTEKPLTGSPSEVENTPPLVIPEIQDTTIPEVEVDEASPPPVVDPETDRKEVADAVSAAAAGKLDEATLARLEKAGIERSVIQTLKEQIEQGAQARRQLHQQELTKEIGGVAEWAKVSEWAADNLTPEEQEDINSVLQSGRPSAQKLIIGATFQKYREAQGPRLIDGTPVSDRGDVFESQAQITEAMKDPRYDKDPAYRSRVMAKIMRSNF